MDNTLEHILRMLNDYRLEHDCDPQRITVSTEVARGLEVEFDMRQGLVLDEAIPKSRRLLRQGALMYIRGVLVVADLEPEHVMDVR